MNKTLNYRYTHSQTTATTGFFTCLPPDSLSIEEALACLEQSPNDSFMRRHILNTLLQLEHDDEHGDERPKGDGQGSGRKDAANAPGKGSALLRALLAGREEASPVLSSLLAELSIFDPENILFGEEFGETEKYSPLVYLHAARRPDQVIQETWRKLFTANLTGHRKLPLPDESALPPLYPVSLRTLGEQEHWSVQPKTTLAQLHAEFSAPREESREEKHGHAGRERWTRPPAEESAARALERLTAGGIIAGEEMRHESSLSPIALQRPWHIRLRVEHGRHNYTLEGRANTYGRGLSLPAARASCLMEMVERASAYASISPHGLLHKSGPSEILFARRSELLAQGHDVIDINAFNPDRPYADQPLHFIWGHRPPEKAGQAERGGRANLENRVDRVDRAVLVPLQMVYLFSNLDEPDLSDAPGSTGLASGNIMEEAKVAALSELLERDAEATNIFHKSRCFALQAADPEIRRLLDAYAAQGVNIQFQDITSSLGFPCVKCFVVSAKGQIHRATGAGLDAKRAIVSALTETPFPFPHGPGSGPGLRNLPVISYESLPSYTLESPARNLALLEELLRSNGLEPVYVDLSRSDLELPVVRALVPGLHGSAELDSTSLIPKRLYEHYLRVHARQPSTA